MGGIGLARGYHRREELTAKSFFPNPFAEHGGRLYRTGDVARYLPDGRIVILGRRDNQVKIRGYRVEVEEIEHIIRRFDDVNDCAVVARQDSSGTQLWAFLTGGLVDGSVGPLRNLLRS